MVQFIDLAELAIGTSLLTGGYGVMLPPLFGSPMPSPMVLMVAVVAAIVGCLFIGRGIYMAIARSDVQRPDIDSEHDHTLDWIVRP